MTHVITPRFLDKQMATIGSIYRRDKAVTRDKMVGKPAKVKEGEQGPLKAIDMGPLLGEDVVEKDESFCQHLVGYSGW